MKYLIPLLCVLLTFLGLTQAQNVGIGTPSPSEKLDVDGKVRIRGGELWFTDNSDLDDYIYGPVNRNLNVRIQANEDTDDFSVEVNNGSGTFVDQFYVNRVESYFRGNVGIGTTAPGKKLEVHNNSDIIANFKRTNSNSVGVSLEGNTGDLTRIYGAEKAMRVFHTPSGGSATEVFTIETNGNTQVQGDLRIANGTNINEFSTDGTLGGNSDNALPTEQAVKTYVDNQVGGSDDWDKSGNEIYNNNSGFVGIGSSNPDAKLHINTSSSDTYPAAQLFFSTDGTSGTGSYSMGVDPSDSDKFKIGNSWNPSSGTYMTLTSSGNLGIGTADPAEKLHINGAIRGNQADGALRISTADGYVDVGPRNTTWSHFSTDRPRFWFNQGLTVDGGEIGSHSGDNLSLQTNGTTRITALQSNGNVGINETNPSAKFEVNGSTKLKTLNQGANANERFYPNVISDAQNTTVNGAWIVHTPIPRNSNQMFTIRVHGYGYGNGDVIDFTISGYSYSGSSGNIDGSSGV